MSRFLKLYGLDAQVMNAMREKLEKMDAKLDKILVESELRSKGTKAGDEQRIQEKNSNQTEQDKNQRRDCKRLKERLKKSLRLQGKNFSSESESVTWLEYIFGICDPDQRVGKIGSR